MAAYERLPTSEKTPPPPPPSRIGPKVQVALYMIAWTVSSNSTILFNKWIIDNSGFGYPILLTFWHLFFAAVVTQILARTTTLLDSRHELPISRRFYLRTILPIGLASSGSLVLGNFVYLYLSVSFIQMLKASAPGIVLLTSWLWGLASPSCGQVINILCIMAGVAMASAGALDFSWLGVLFQAGSLVFEAVRVVMIQAMLSGRDMAMDPLVGLYYYAPVCAAMNLAIACVVELPRFQVQDLERVGWPLLLLSGVVAFMLSFTSMTLIGRTSGLVTNLTGIFKNILLVAFSTVVWHTPLSTLQVVGYSISTSSILYYAFGGGVISGGYEAAKNWLAAAGAGDRFLFSPEKNRLHLRVCIGVVMGLFGLSGLYLFTSYHRA